MNHGWMVKQSFTRQPDGRRHVARGETQATWTNLTRHWHPVTDIHRPPGERGVATLRLKGTRRLNVLDEVREGRFGLTEPLKGAYVTRGEVGLRTAARRVR